MASRAPRTERRGNGDATPIVTAPVVDSTGYSRPVSDDERRVYDIHRPFTGGWQLRVNQRPLGGIYATLGLGPLADATSHCDPRFYGGYKGVPADCPNHIDLGPYVK